VDGERVKGKKMIINSVEPNDNVMEVSYANLSNASCLSEDEEIADTSVEVMEEREMLLSQRIEVEKCCLKKSKIVLNPYRQLEESVDSPKHRESSVSKKTL
jgi:hypothetical protein